MSDHESSRFTDDDFNNTDRYYNNNDAYGDNRLFDVLDYDEADGTQELLIKLQNATTEEEFYEARDLLKEKGYYGDYDELPTYSGGRHDLKRNFRGMHDEYEYKTGDDPDKTTNGIYTEEQ